METLDNKEQWIIDHINTEIVEAEADMEVMRWALEDIYEERLNEYKNYYTDNVALLYKSFHSCFDELKSMEDQYKYKEEYEKCQVIIEVNDILKKKFIPGYN
jgi:hypothetical protein